MYIHVRVCLDKLPLFKLIIGLPVIISVLRAGQTAQATTFSDEII